MDSGELRMESGVHTPDVIKDSVNGTNDDNEMIPRELDVTAHSPGVSAMTLSSNINWMSKEVSKIADISRKGDGSDMSIKAEIMETSHVHAEACSEDIS